MKPESTHPFSKLIFSLLILIISFSLEGLAQQYTVLGDATQLSGCNCYRLTQNTNSQAGAIYQNQTIDLTNPFDYTFSVYLGCNNGSGADGIVFALTTNPNGLGTTGGGLGYAGNTQPNSLAVEFDTYTNGQYGDPNEHHIGILSAGQLNHNVFGPVPALPNAANIDDCQNHTARITWDPATNMFEVYLDGNLRVSINIPNIANTYFSGNTVVNWGWTGATGGSINEQRVCVETTSNWVAGDNYQACTRTVQFTDVSNSSAGSIQSWNWDFGDGNTSNQQNPQHTYANPGTYNVTLNIVDINGCNNQFANDLVIHDSIQVNANITQPLCFGDQGEISLAANGGVGSGTYDYNWDSGPTTATISNLDEGTYEVTVSDSLCNTVGSYTINDVDSFDVNISYADDSCRDNSGSISIQTLGATSPYSYTWNPANLSGNSASGLSEGDYYFTITDANNCTYVDSAVISAPANALQVNSAVTDESCFNAEDGTITANISGGTAPYNTQNGAINGNNFSADSLSAGTYTYTIEDDYGCTVSFSRIVNQPDSIELSLSTQDISCNGQSDGAISMSVSGGNQPYIFDWNDNDSTQNRTNLDEGNYTVTLSDANNCTISGSSQISEPAPLETTGTIDSIRCNGFADGSIRTNTSGGTSPYTFNWNDGSSGSALSNLSPGNYSVTTTDQNGCSTIDTFSLEAVSEIWISAESDTYEINLGEEVIINTNNFTGNNAISNINWSPPFGLDCYDCESVTASPSQSVNYTIELRDDNGCITDTTVFVDVNFDRIFYIPNAFSPNGDGKNDGFRIYGEAINNFRLQIFDRWGNLVFESTDPLEEWDGTYKGAKVSADTYVYSIYADFADKESFRKKGSINLLR